MPDSFDNYKSVANDAMQQIRMFAEHIDVASLFTQSTGFPLIGYSVCSDMYRGYACPDPVYEKLIGNSHRGRMSKREPKQKRYQKYYGDTKIRLIQYYEVVQKTDSEQESALFQNQYLIYDENRCFGVSLFDDGVVDLIDLAEYENDQIKRYTISAVTGNHVLQNGIKEQNDLMLLDCRNFRYSKTGSLVGVDYIGRCRALSYSLTWNNDDLSYECKRIWCQSEYERIMESIDL